MEYLVAETFVIVIHNAFTKQSVKFTKVLFTLLHQFLVLEISQASILLVHTGQILTTSLLV